MEVLGDEELHEYVHTYNLKIPKEVKKLMRGRDFERVPWDNFIKDKNRELCSPDAIDLLGKMLKYDKNKRINCKDAMAHAYFDPVREFVAKQDAEKQARMGSK
jgi:casein kinase II subunit alpha